MKTNDEEITALTEEITADVKRIYESTKNPVLVVLRMHLYSEQLLERIITAALPYADRWLSSSNPSFHHKLSLTDALDVLERNVVDAVRGLNAVRNQCAHENDKEITLADVDRIGRPLGSSYTATRHEHKSNPHTLLMLVCASIAGALGGKAHVQEKKVSTKKKD